MSVTARFVGGTALIATALAHGPTAHAQTNRCTGKEGSTPDQYISDCTAVIQSGNYTGKNLGYAFTTRGLSYEFKGEHDRAIQDFDRAVKLIPYDSDAFLFRAGAYYAKRQYDRAIQDYDQAIKLNPNYAPAIYNRGIAKEKMGDKAGAAADMAAARRIDPNISRKP